VKNLTFFSGSLQSWGPIKEPMYLTPIPWIESPLFIEESFFFFLLQRLLIRYKGSFNVSLRFENLIFNIYRYN
jgi:hypothetical protein